MDLNGDIKLGILNGDFKPEGIINGDCEWDFDWGYCMGILNGNLNGDFEWEF